MRAEADPAIERRREVIRIMLFTILLLVYYIAISIIIK